MIFLTVNDTPSGVFKSQVVDVVIFLNDISKQEIKLVSFISFRNYWANRHTIKSWYKNSTVIPMVPGIHNWKKNLVSLRFIKKIKRDKIIARGVMAFDLASKLNEKVIYDGRGAIKAELQEFPDMIPNKMVVEELIAAEANAVSNAFFKIAVSNKLVDYWKTEYGYSGSNHVVIPCTFSTAHTNGIDTKGDLRKELGLGVSDIVLIYSGGISGWQSFDSLKVKIHEWVKNPFVKIIFLSPSNPQISELILSYPKSVFQKWVLPDKVQEILLEADYGILIRDKNTTNRVSSPVKFAEYLAAGLKIIISPAIGDYSEMVVDENLGFIFDGTLPDLKKTNDEERLRIKNFVTYNLSKEAFANSYKRLIE